MFILLIINTKPCMKSFPGTSIRIDTATYSYSLGFPY